MELHVRKDHWEQFYATHAEHQLSWFELRPDLSLEMVRKSARDKSQSIIDVGGGNSRLVDCLVAEGYSTVAVLDVSSRALELAQERLGSKAARVQWIESDALAWNCSTPFDIWHDRAAYHFLTDATDRAAYVELAAHAVKSGGALIVATFALDGPRSCSGLPTYRANAEMLAGDFAPSFQLVESLLHEHETPSGVVQQFQFARFLRQ